ncbi:MAG: ferritin [bacterium]|nr:ferritin [bacterium]
MKQLPKSIRLHSDLATELNEHVSLEARSAFVYYSMASWAETRGLSGFAAWFVKEAEGEFAHMRQFVDHLNDRGFQATFAALPAPPSEWESVQDVFESVAATEHELCERIESLIQLSHDRKDHFTGSFLQGFVPQQIADMAEADEILDRLRLAGGDGQGIILIDQELRSKAGA